MNMTITGKGLLDALAASLSALLANGMEQVLGPGVQTPVLGPLTWADLGIFVCFVFAILAANAIAAAVLRRRKRQEEFPAGPRTWRGDILQIVDKPLYLLVWIYGIYIAASPLVEKLATGNGPHPFRQFLDALFNFGFFAALFWMFFRFTTVLEARLRTWTNKNGSKLDEIVLPLVVRSLRAIVPVVGIIFALPVIGLSQEYAAVVSKGSSILMILVLAWILFQAVQVGEHAVLAKYDIKAADNLQARKVYTQVHVLGKTIYVVIAIFTVASVLMLFEEVRRLGTSLLASAGVVGVIAGFAAQRTIANLFAGFQVAITQPIRLDDVVIVETEWGRVEEITLTYVVVHLWDDRRLILPLSYFIEKPFQNWTRASADLLGSVLLWVDYSLPVENIRSAAKQIIESSTLWDKRFWNLQVSDANERAMQIRILATATDSSKAWDLRCEIREKLIGYIQQNHPKGLPRTRSDVNWPQSNGTQPASPQMGPRGTEPAVSH